MKSCFEGHKRRRIYHPHKSPIICVILFFFFPPHSLPLLEDTGEIRRPGRLGDCPHRQPSRPWREGRGRGTAEEEEEELEGRSVPVGEI